MPFLLQFTTIIVLVDHTTFTGMPILLIFVPILPILADINTDINIGWSDIFFTDTDITDTDTDINIGAPLFQTTDISIRYQLLQTYNESYKIVSKLDY